MCWESIFKKLIIHGCSFIGLPSVLSSGEFSKYEINGKESQDNYCIIKLSFENQKYFILVWFFKLKGGRHCMVVFEVVVSAP